MRYQMNMNIMSRKLKYPLAIGVVLSVLFICYLFIAPDRRTPKVYDCFLFYNELELLEIRLNEMNDSVDKFVIVEACETFRGNPKSYIFEENKHLFEKFADKIIHVKVDQKVYTENPWIRERFQRQQIMRGLVGCHKNDIVILSDIDEIVRGSKLPEIIELLQSRKAQAVVCEQDMYLGFFNRYQSKWHGTVCTNYHVIKRISTKSTRRLRNMQERLMRRTGVTKMICLPDAGWHFTSIGGVARQILKLESYSHAEFDTPELKQAEKILQTFRSHQYVEIDSSFPKWIVDNRSQYEEMGFIDSISSEARE